MAQNMSAMSEIYFYHLTRSSVAQTVIALLPRALQAGWRVVIRGGDHERLVELDTQLWTFDRESFLPHALAGSANDADHPILLSQEMACPNGAKCVFAIDGAKITVAERDNLARACVLFDGRDEQSVQAARAQWREVTQQGWSAQYWSEQEGRWRRKA